jgi:hypothetical protein
METMIPNELRLGLNFGDLPARATQVSQGELALPDGGCQTFLGFNLKSSVHRNKVTMNLILYNLVYLKILELLDSCIKEFDQDIS